MPGYGNILYSVNFDSGLLTFLAHVNTQFEKEMVNILDFQFNLMSLDISRMLSKLTELRMLFGSFRLVNTELRLLIELVHRDVRGLRHSGEGVVCNNSTSECDDDTVVIPDEDDDDPDDTLLDDMTTIVMMATVRMSMSKTMNNAMRRFC